MPVKPYGARLAGVRQLRTQNGFEKNSPAVGETAAGEGKMVFF